MKLEFVSGNQPSQISQLCFKQMVNSLHLLHVYGQRNSLVNWRRTRSVTIQYASRH